MTEWNSKHPLWEEFHDIVGSAALDIINEWRKPSTDSSNADVKYAHQRIAEAGEEIIDLFANQQITRTGETS